MRARVLNENLWGRRTTPPRSWRGLTVTPWQVLGPPFCPVVKRIPSSRLFLNVSTLFCVDGVGWCSTGKRRHSINRESKPLQSVIVRNYLAEIGREMTQPGNPDLKLLQSILDSRLHSSYGPEPATPSGSAPLFPSGWAPRGGAGRGAESAGPHPQGASWHRHAQPRQSRFLAGEEGGSQTRGRRPSRGAGKTCFLRQVVSDGPGGATAAGGRRRRVRVSRAEPGCGGRGA